MKSVLISIQPKWCELIASGKKTVEVRKTRPKIETPFKCYIYCTNTKPYLVWGDVFRGNWETEFTSISGYNRKDAEKIWDVFNGKVIGEFICTEITEFESEFVDDDCYEYVASLDYDEDGDATGFIEWSNDSDFSYESTDFYKKCCVKYEELKKYMGYGINQFYAWHISDLVIYDEPKELSEFYTFCPEWEKEYFTAKCLRCKYYFSNCADMRHECTVEGEKPLKRPPQSWCYVE